MEIRAYWPGELEVRARGRRLGGRFRYSQRSGDAMATVRDRGRTRKERIEGDAFGWQLRAFKKVEQEIADTIGGALDDARVQLLRQELERRNVHVLAGHSFDKPLGDLRSGTATITSNQDALEFEVELPDEADQPTYMRDMVRQVQAGLVGGVSPGFRVPPRSIVANAEGLEPEPGNPAVMVRVIRQAVLHEVSLVTRPAYSETDVKLRADDFPPTERTGRRRLWL